jgi:HD superfamily phosphohydrolase
MVHSTRIPVHGFVEFSEWERDIINHPVFQRLRRIRQLAFSEHLYPGSVHTRFEHSLGVMEVATRLYDAISRRHEDLLRSSLGWKPENSRPKTLVRLAALLHDVGHAPLSHSGEELMPNGLSHEDYSAELIRHEMKDVIDDHRENRGVLRITGDEIAAFYAGRTPKDARAELTPELLFWRELVHGQLDADRMDYLLRDSYHCGVAYGTFDLDRIVDTLTVVVDPDPESGGAPRIGFKDGGMHAAEGLILARYFMFTQVYFHPVRKAYDHHAAQILARLLANSDGQGRLPDARTSSGRKEFLELDDWSVMRFIRESDSDRHSEAIRSHSHDRCVFQTSEAPDPAELDEFNRVYEGLKKEVGDARVESAKKEWYNIDDKEVLIASSDARGAEPSRAKRLSAVSNVVGKIGASKQLLLFVPHSDTERAKSAVVKVRKEVG